MTASMRIGIDLGGTKISAVAMGADGSLSARQRIATPQDDYTGSIAAIVALVQQLETEAHTAKGAPVGIGMPGSISPVTDRIQNANSTWLNGTQFKEDIETALGREVRMANDANCFTLSEATDGAAAGANVVFGVIAGTGCGGGLIVGGKALAGPNRIAGEWGHIPLPWPKPNEYPGPTCWCGRSGCLEAWISGPGLARDHERETGQCLSVQDIASRAQTGDAKAQASLERHADRMARGLAVVTNLLDPDVIVLGGGLSNLSHLYDWLPDLMRPYVFADYVRPDIRRPVHGDDSGVRGAAWLW